MKIQNSIETEPSFKEQSSPVFSNTIEHARHIHFFSFLAGLVVGFTALTDKSSAEIQWHKDKQTGAIECVQKNESTGKQVKVRFAAKKEIGEYSSLERVQDPFVGALKAVDVKMPFVNEHIDDPAAWKKFVWDEAEKLGFSYEKRGELSPQSAIELSIKIVKKNLRFARELDFANMGEYDAALTAEIDATPINQVLMKKGIGVCRHFSVLLDKVYEVLSEEILPNTFMRRLITNDAYHAVNLIGEARKEDEDTTTVILSPIDTSVGRKIVQVGSLFLDNFNIKTYETSTPEKEALYPFYSQYLAPILSKKEHLDSKKYFLEKTNFASTDDMAKYIELAFLYLGALEDVSSKSGNTHNVFTDFQTYLKNHVAEYEKEAARDEFDLLHSVIFNIYKIHANAQKDPGERAKIQHEGEALRLKSFMVRYDALIKAGEFHKALKTGEDYADMLARTGDEVTAEEFYHTLMDVYQQNREKVGSYARSMPRDSSEYALFVTVEPFTDDETLKKYLQYKKERIWSQK